MIILNTENMLDAAAEIAAKSPKLAPTIDALVGNIEDALGDLAELLAQAEGVQHHETSNQPGFGGLCSAFSKGSRGKRSKILQTYDAGGEW